MTAGARPRPFDALALPPAVGTGAAAPASCSVASAPFVSTNTLSSRPRRSQPPSQATRSVKALGVLAEAWFAEGVTSMPMFPLGSVLFPHMPLPLRVFEKRYLVMLSRILGSEPAEFGVVLIERGQEVGGGEQRFRYGTVARIVQVDATEEFVVLVAQGERRFEVTEWLEEDPHPQAIVRDLPHLEWTDALLPLKQQAERAVRRVLSLASEFTEQLWPPDVELSTDPTAAAWQLAAIAPLGPLDQVALLRSTTMAELLNSVLEYTAAAEESLSAPWPPPASLS